MKYLRGRQRCVHVETLRQFDLAAAAAQAPGSVHVGRDAAAAAAECHRPYLGYLKIGLRACVCVRVCSRARAYVYMFVMLSRTGPGDRLLPRLPPHGLISLIGRVSSHAALQ